MLFFSCKILPLPSMLWYSPLIRWVLQLESKKIIHHDLKGLLTLNVLITLLIYLLIETMTLLSGDSGRQCGGAEIIFNKCQLSSLFGTAEASIQPGQTTASVLLILCDWHHGWTEVKGIQPMTLLWCIAMFYPYPYHAQTHEDLCGFWPEITDLL